MTPEEIKTLGHAFFDGKTLQYQYENRDWMRLLWDTYTSMRRPYITTQGG